MTLARLLGQSVVYVVFMAVVGYFAAWPSYRPLAPDAALVRLSFSHAGARREPCRRLTPEEIAALAPNMRRPMDCVRARVPVLVEIELDGRLVYRAALEPSGIASDGASTAYERFEVPAGVHRIIARLRDSRRTEGFDYEAETEVTLAPAESMVIDFDPNQGGFVFL